MMMIAVRSDSNVFSGRLCRAIGLIFRSDRPCNAKFARAERPSNFDLQAQRQANDSQVRRLESGPDQRRSHGGIGEVRRDAVGLRGQPEPQPASAETRGMRPVSTAWLGLRGTDTVRPERIAKG